MPPMKRTMFLAPLLTGLAATVNERGEISQGTSGGDWLLRGVEYRVVDQGD